MVDQINKSLPTLRPCPFCNGEAMWQYSSGYPSGVYCMPMECRVNVFFGNSLNPQEIANRWNSRKALVNV